jgi:NAD(P)-dependent dehydrogenase (short-subunit alcohol dehydrogenase family)
MITGAGRGMDLDFAKAVLASGDKLVAAGRNRERVAKAIGASENLLVTTMDVTKPADAVSAVNAAVERFGRIDVLVNKDASFYAGYFEDLTPESLLLFPL